MYPYPLFTFLGQGVTLYGICIGVGILVCLLCYFLFTKRLGMSNDVQDFSFYIAIIAIVLGFGAAALYQSIYTWIAEGVFKYNGITAMGGFVGGAAVFIFAYFFIGKFMFTGNNKGLPKKEFPIILNTAPSCITVAHAFGRIGCLMAGCCYGMEASTGFVIYNHGAYRVPVQLYEAIFLFILFAILTILLLKYRCNITMPIYLISYGVWRFIIEIFRGDVAERTFFMGLFPSQWQSIIFIAGGIFLLVFYAVKKIPYFLPKQELKAAEPVENSVDDKPEEK